MKKIKQTLQKMKSVAASERDSRKKKTGEVFTPEFLVKEMLDKLEENNFDAFLDPEQTFLDPACGDGNFLVEVLKRKMQNGIDALTSIKTIYGVDIVPENVIACRKCLLAIMWGYNEKWKKSENIRRKCCEVVCSNIVCADALKYDFSFDKKQRNENESMIEFIERI